MQSNLIKRPLITEKSLQATSGSRFTFEVDRHATKSQIKHAIETLFKVHVIKVRTSIVTSSAKRNRQGKNIHTIAAWKKAIVELKSGEKIDLFDIKTSEK